jgi:hypothetical protein
MKKYAACKWEEILISYDINFKNIILSTKFSSQEDK